MVMFVNMGDCEVSENILFVVAAGHRFWERSYGILCTCHILHPAVLWVEQVVLWSCTAVRVGAIEVTVKNTRPPAYGWIRTLPNIETVVVVHMVEIKQCIGVTTSHWGLLLVCHAEIRLASKGTVLVTSFCHALGESSHIDWNT